MVHGGDDVAYWQARARALEARVEALESRLVAMAGALPADALELLELDVEDFPVPGPAGDLVSGLEATHTMVPSDVETELSLAWQRLRRG